MDDLYDELSGMIGGLEADLAILESVIMNGQNRRANNYLTKAMDEIRQALSYMQDAELEIVTEGKEV